MLEVGRYEVYIWGPPVVKVNLHRSCLWVSSSNKSLPSFPPHVTVQTSLVLRVSMHLFTLCTPKLYPTTLCPHLKTKGWGAGLIKLRAHPLKTFSPQVFLMGTRCMFKDKDREPCQGRFLRKAQTLLSNDSSRANRCYQHRLINSGSDCSHWKTRRK